MPELGQSVRNDLLWRSLDHAISSVEDGGPLVPFVMTETTLQRFLHDTLEASKAEAERFVAKSSARVIALAYDGYLTQDGVRSDAVFVQAFDRDEKTGILVAQRYRPKSSSNDFSTVGNPVLVDEPSNPMRRKKRFGIF